MQIMPDPIEFEWDSGNKDKNLIKHKITNQVIEEVFFNLPLVVANDIKHSNQEKRYLALGQTDNHKKLSVIFTIRKHKIRVISARPMSQKEKQFYETKQ